MSGKQKKSKQKKRGVEEIENEKSEAQQRKTKRQKHDEYKEAIQNSETGLYDHEESVEKRNTKRQKGGKCKEVIQKDDKDGKTKSKRYRNKKNKFKKLKSKKHKSTENDTQPLNLQKERICTVDGGKETFEAFIEPHVSLNKKSTKKTPAIDLSGVLPCPEDSTEKCSADKEIEQLISEYEHWTEDAGVQNAEMDSFFAMSELVKQNFDSSEKDSDMDLLSEAHSNGKPESEKEDPGFIYFGRYSDEVSFCLQKEDEHIKEGMTEEKFKELQKRNEERIQIKKELSEFQKLSIDLEKYIPSLPIPDDFDDEEIFTAAFRDLLLVKSSYTKENNSADSMNEEEKTSYPELITAVRKILSVSIKESYESAFTSEDCAEELKRSGTCLKNLLLEVNKVLKCCDDYFLFFLKSIMTDSHACDNLFKAVVMHLESSKSYFKKIHPFLLMIVFANYPNSNCLMLCKFLDVCKVIFSVDLSFSYSIPFLQNLKKFLLFSMLEVYVDVNQTHFQLRKEAAKFYCKIIAKYYPNQQKNVISYLKRIVINKDSKFCACYGALCAIIFMGSLVEAKVIPDIFPSIVNRLKTIKGFAKRGEHKETSKFYSSNTIQLANQSNQLKQISNNQPELIAENQPELISKNYPSFGTQYEGIFDCENSNTISNQNVKVIESHSEDPILLQPSPCKQKKQDSSEEIISSIDTPPAESDSTTSNNDTECPIKEYWSMSPCSSDEMCYKSNTTVSDNIEDTKYSYGIPIFLQSPSCSSKKTETDLSLSNKNTQNLEHQDSNFSTAHCTPPIKIVMRQKNENEVVKNKSAAIENKFPEDEHPSVENEFPFKNKSTPDSRPERNEPTSLSGTKDEDVLKRFDTVIPSENQYAFLIRKELFHACSRLINEYVRNAKKAYPLLYSSNSISANAFRAFLDYFGQELSGLIPSEFAYETFSG